MTVVGLICLGLFIGILSGLLGIGGGTIMVPAFRLIFGMAPIASTATSLFTIIPTSISGAVTHVRKRTCVPKLGLALGLGGACTSPVGVWLASVSPDWAIMLVAALVVAYSSISMFRKAVKAPRSAEAEAPAGAEVDASTVPVAFSPTARHLVAGVLIGLVAGLASGYVGVGGGFIMVPLMLMIMRIPMKLASGTSLIAVMMLAIPGTVEQGILGNIDYLAGIACACGTIPGAYLGARMVSRIPERRLRFLFAGFLLVAAVLLLAKETGILG